MRWLVWVGLLGAQACNVTDVTWRRVSENATGHFYWRGNSTCKHYGGDGDVFALLKGTHTLVLGNSVARHAVVAVHRMMRRKASEGPVDGVAIGAHDLKDAESSIWAAHGAGSADFDEKGDLLSDECRASQKQLHYPKSIINCCLARRRPSERGALVSYAFTNTPSERAIGTVLKAWEGSSNCASSLSPTHVVLALTDIEPPFKKGIVKRVVAARNNQKVKSTFFILTAPHKAKVNMRDLLQHEAQVLDAFRGIEGIRVVPVSSATAAGVDAGALLHTQGNNWHFFDAGRYYLAQALLNAIRHDRDAAAAPRRSAVL